MLFTNTFAPRLSRRDDSGGLNLTGAKTMTRMIKPTLLLGSALLASTIPQLASAATAEEQILARLNTLERENNALRARLNRLESPKVTRPSVRGTEVYS